MTQLCEDLQRGGTVETFPWTCVQSVSHRVQLALGISGQVRPLGEILAQQTIGVLVGTPLPGRMRIGKVDLDRETVRQPFMFRHFFSPIVGQRFPQRSGDMSQFLCEPFAGTARICAVHAGQDPQADRPLHQSPDRRPIACALEAIAFPVARHCPVGHVYWAVGNRRHVGELPTTIRAARTRASGLTGSASGLGLSHTGSIGMAAYGVAAYFPAQRAGSSPQEPRELTQRLPLSQPQTQRFTFSITEVRVAFLWHRNTLAHSGWSCCT